MFASFGGLCIANSGEMYLCDYEGGRVFVLTPSAGVIGTLGEPGSQPGQLNSAADIALAPNGDLYVVDLMGHRIVHLGSGATPTRKESWGAVKVVYR